MSRSELLLDKGTHSLRVKRPSFLDCTAAATGAAASAVPQPGLAAGVQLALRVTEQGVGQTELEAPPPL